MPLYTNKNPLWQSFMAKVQEKIKVKKRSALNAEKPGSYQPVVVLENSVLNKNEILAGSVFFSGYGAISQPKLFFQGPTHVFSEVESSWHQGFDVIREEGKIRLIFAAKPMNEFVFGNVQLSAAVVTTDNTLDVDMFTDYRAGNSVIYSENRLVNPPVSFKLRVKNNCRPGTYEITFVFTYFNGESWVTATEKASMTVRSLLQRLDWRVATLAIFAAVVSMTADLETARQNVINLYKYLAGLNW